MRRVYAEAAEAALRLDLPALLPLIPAMRLRDGRRTALSREVLERISALPLLQPEKQKLLHWAATFATLHLKKHRVEDILIEVSRRNRYMLDPLRDFPWLRETYEEGERNGVKKGLKKGHTEGHKKGLQEGLRGAQAEMVKMLQKQVLDLCHERFGDRVPGTDRVLRLSEPTLLARLLGRLGAAPSLDHALAAIGA